MAEMMSLQPIFWVAAAAFFLIAEFVTPSALVALWFVAGSVAALLVSLVCHVLWLQVLVFLAVSLAALLALRPLIVRRVRKDFVPTNADRVLGKTARVTVAVRPDETGRVQVENLGWAARSDVPLEEGELCVVESIAGATLTVRPVVSGHPAEK